jgi:hypothetical protein
MILSAFSCLICGRSGGIGRALIEANMGTEVGLSLA